MHGSYFFVIRKIKMLLNELFKDYKKNELYDFVREMGIKGCSSYTKPKLIDKACEFLLDKSTMESRLGILTDEEFSIFEKAVKAPVALESFEDEHAAYEVYEIGYMGIADSTAIVPDDVKEAYLDFSKDENFEEKRKRFSWLKVCLEFVENMYGIAPIEQVKMLYNSKTGCREDAVGILEMLKAFPADKLGMIIDEKNMTVTSKLFEDKEVHDFLVEEQGDKPFYEPTYAQIQTLYKEMYLCDTIAYKKFKEFLSERTDDEDNVEDIVSQVWFDLASGTKDGQEVMQWVLNVEGLDLEKNEADELLKILQEVNNSTRMLFNRGFTPNEVYALNKDKKAEAAPVAVKEAPKPEEIMSAFAPEADFENNVTAFPFLQNPGAVMSKTVTAAKKIYPNDPCPCGSGKKYKKCCGR